MLPKPKSIFEDMPEFAPAPAPVAAVPEPEPEPEPVLAPSVDCLEDAVVDEVPIGASTHEAVEDTMMMEPFTLDGHEEKVEVSTGVGPPPNCTPVFAPMTSLVKYLDLLQLITEKQFALLPTTNSKAEIQTRAQLVELFAKASVLKEGLHTMFREQEFPPPRE